MLFSYNWLQSYFRKPLPKPKELAELLSMRAFEVGLIEKRGGDWVLDVDVRPNRSDCFSHLGISREIAAILDLRSTLRGASSKIENLRLKENKGLKAPAFVKTTAFGSTKSAYGQTKSAGKKDFIKVEVRAKNACLRYTARVIADVKVGKSPEYVQERLMACGLQPINNIVDAVNYVMLEMGQPIHAFDFEKISGIQNQKSWTSQSGGLPGGSQIKNQKQRLRIKNIIVRKAKKGEKITTLDGKRYDLDENILVIADEESPLAIAGIKGGEKAEIDDKTKIVVLESANFDGGAVRRSSRLLNLKTDASWRFEHGLDPNLTEIAINRAADLIQEISGGKAARGIIDFYPKRVLPKRIKLDLDYVEKLLGTKISRKEIIKILKSLDFRISEQRTANSEQLIIETPTRRLDISLPEDLIEEIGRIYGYEKIRPVLPIATLIPAQRNDKIFWQEMTRNILKEAGFSEVYNYSFISEKDISIYQHKSAVMEIENPMSVEQKYLRPSLIINLLKNIKKNSARYSEIKIFEIGKTFIKEQGAGGKEQLEEKTMLSGVIAGKTEEEGFYELKGVVDMLLNKLGISDVWYDEYQPSPEESKISWWHPQRRAELKVNGEEIGFLGEISLKISGDLKIKQSIHAFDIDFEKLVKQCSEEHEYRPISPYPAAVRDLAILVPRDTKVEEVLNIIETAGGPLVRDVDLFDIYEGEELPGGRKNFAFHIIYQAEDRTLSSKEIDEVHGKIVKELEKDPSWEVRR